MNVLKACSMARTVKRLVITSSVAALAVPRKEDFPQDGIFDEKIWTDIDAEGLHPYRKSKTLAERAAWDFQKELPEGQRFEIVTICPGFIVGPSINCGDAMSQGWAKEVVTGEKKPVASVYCTFVDVRDVAFAHLAAAKVPEAANQRFILVNETIKQVDAAQLISDEFLQKGYPVSLTENPDASTNKPIYKRTASEKVLGVKYTPTKQALVD